MNETAVYICTDPGVPAFGAKGCSVHVQEVLRRLTVRFREVHLITTRPGGTPPPELAGVVVHALTRPAGPDLATREQAQCAADAAAAEVLATLFRRVGPGPVELVYQRYALWSAATLETARALGVPSVLEINAPLLTEQAAHRGLVDAARATRRTARLLAAADAPFAVSGPVARWAERLDPRRRTVPVVPNGVDVERFTPAGVAPAGSTGALTVAFSGTFKPWHGLDLLVGATAAARERGARLRLLLIGDGPEHTATVAAAARHGIPVTATGQVDPARVPALLHGADLAVAPYPAPALGPAGGPSAGPHYFSPLKVAEYLAAGLPTVASAIADLPDLVADGVEALLVAPGDLDGTADALVRLATEPALRRRLAAGGRRAAEDRFSWASVVDTTLALLPAHHRAEIA
ncbi:MAG TPA: glycosyltransferase [Pseudonocardia sp.]|nr:glycosyltransferase [Pseudonocardia sp.]